MYCDAQPELLSQPLIPMENSSNFVLLLHTGEERKLLKATASYAIILIVHVLSARLFCKHLKGSHLISDSPSPNPHRGGYLLSS